MRAADRLALARAAALIALGELATHQLRYLLAFGGGAGHELARQGHAYLGLAAPVLVAIALSALAAGVLRAGLSGRSESRDRSFGRAAACYAVAILAVFWAQELVEGVLSTGHPGGAAALLSHGALLALPLSALLGLVCASLDRSVIRLERLAAAGCRGRRPRPARHAEVHRGPATSPLAAAPLAFGLARRPPPLRA